MLAEIDGALAHAKATRAKRRAPVLHLNAPQVLGVTGRAIEVDDGPPIYGYTARQARRIRDRILAAIRAEIETLGVRR